ncbi:MAG: hypothetical protein BWY17_01092 [Deltaproteobacteria bacterium ADurb.Bin207]|nr:MAG: hypothetical protein BWY17_01092 [Deltaproteobacteria bacterium ADurb.Bin207]
MQIPIEGFGFHAIVGGMGMGFASSAGKRASAWVVPLVVMMLGCGSSSEQGASPVTGPDEGTGGNGAAGQGHHEGTGGAAANGSGGSSTGGAGAHGAVGGSGAEAGSGANGGQTGSPFTYGLNLGYYNPQLNDSEESQLGLAAGANSHRHKLTEPFLDRWGDDIHVQELSGMLQAGEQDLVCFLVGASEAHSTAPAGSADWQREHYSPNNLYEPIFTDNGQVNPNNPWAAFVARVVTTYSPYIHTWEVWNEPDQVGGHWQATSSWDTQPPNPSDLIWWNDTIFAYIRLLRVTWEVVHHLDPQGKVALGGIGYPSFLNAILRYTDEPTSGKVDADHPRKGDAYFDVVSFHYYPIFSNGNSDAGAKGLLHLYDQLQTQLEKAGVSGKTFIVTESGAPRFAVDGRPGGKDYAANYLMKAMALAQNAGIDRIDWFILGDSADPGASSSPFDYMGLYENLMNISELGQAILTDTGVAYATLGGLLAGAHSDPVATQALGSPSSVALRTKQGDRAYVVWAETTAGEGASATISVPASHDVTVYRWDYSKTKKTQTLSPNGGAVVVDISSAPSILITPMPVP